MLRIVLDLPPTDLSPNTRVHWARKAKVVRQYRRHAKDAAMSAAFEQDLRCPFETPVVQIAYFNRRKIKPDADNILATLKSAWDGLTDSGVWADDRFCFFFPVRRCCDKANPRVEITITERLPDNCNEILDQIMREK